MACLGRGTPSPNQVGALGLALLAVQSATPTECVHVVVSSPTATQSWNTFLKGFKSRLNTRDLPENKPGLPGGRVHPSRHWRPSGVRSKKAGQPGCLVLPCLYFGALAAVGGET